MSKKKPIVALIYDFDGTLSPGNMQEFGFIQAIGKTPEEFWKMSDEISLGQDASHILCYMKLMIDQANEAHVELKRESFVRFGHEIELFNGVKEWFKLINNYGKEQGVKVEHYINSSGLTEMIEGSPIAKEFKKIFACSFMYDSQGVAVWPAVAVDYTGKTQFIFKINKGIMSIRDTVKVNESQAEDRKRIPFENMIYFGDGQTDIPCMKIVKMFGGNSVAVYPPDNQRKSVMAEKLLKQNRVNFICPADYRKDGDIYNVVTAIIDKIKAENNVKNIRRKVNK